MDIQKALETAMGKIAQLEREVSGYRSQPQPQAPTFDPRAFTADPLGAMTRMGIPVDHVTRVLVAHTLGDQAPPELKVLAAMGPQVSATNALQVELEQLRRQVSELTTSQSKKSAGESFKALAADKAKYPHLASAIAADASLYDEDIQSFGGNVEDFLAKEEKRLARLAPALGVKPPAASVANADTTTDQSKQVTPAVAAALNGEMPPLPETKVGVFTQADHDKLKEEVVRKASMAASPE